jgi:hypothetical protein
MQPQKNTLVEGDVCKSSLQHKRSEGLDFPEVLNIFETLSDYQPFVYRTWEVYRMWEDLGVFNGNSSLETFLKGLNQIQTICAIPTEPVERDDLMDQKNIDE